MGYIFYLTLVTGNTKHCHGHHLSSYLIQDYASGLRPCHYVYPQLNIHGKIMPNHVLYIHANTQSILLPSSFCNHYYLLPPWNPSSLCSTHSSFLLLPNKAQACLQDLLPVQLTFDGSLLNQAHLKVAQLIIKHNHEETTNIISRFGVFKKKLLQQQAKVAWERYKALEEEKLVL
jgi:hypothetical protein